MPVRPDLQVRQEPSLDSVGAASRNCFHHNKEVIGLMTTGIGNSFPGSRQCPLQAELDIDTVDKAEQVFKGPISASKTGNEPLKTGVLCYCSKA